MRVITGQNNVDVFLKMYKAVAGAPEVETRGSLTRNVPNMAVMLDPKQPVITAFKSREFNLDYAKKEWLWYLGADPKDDSIEQHAKMWKKLKQSDGSYYSNYGQYIFAKDANGNSQFGYLLKTLKADKNTRRASIVLLKREHLYPENTDVVCTYAINFTIIESCLDMTVMMRSNDVIFGFTNDAFCFWNLYMMVHAILLKDMPWLRYGNYTHFTNSMHVYERHYAMINHILHADTGSNAYTRHHVPHPTYKEALDLFVSNGKEGTGDYCTWLKTEQGPILYGDDRSSSD